MILFSYLWLLARSPPLLHFGIYWTVNITLYTKISLKYFHLWRLKISSDISLIFFSFPLHNFDHSPEFAYILFVKIRNPHLLKMLCNIWTASNLPNNLEPKTFRNILANLILFGTWFPTVSQTSSKCDALFWHPYHSSSKVFPWMSSEELPYHGSLMGLWRWIAKL